MCEKPVAGGSEEAWRMVKQRSAQENAHDRTMPPFLAGL